MSDSMFIHQPRTIENPIVVFNVQKIKGKYSLTIAIQEEGQPYNSSTSVSFFVDIPLEKILEQFPNATVVPRVIP